MRKMSAIMKTVIGRCNAALIAPAIIFAAVHGAQATTARASFGVSAFVGGSCSMETQPSASGLGGSGHAYQAVGDLTVHCPQAVAYSVELRGAGANGSNTIVTADKSGSSRITGVYGRANADAMMVTLTY